MNIVLIEVEDRKCAKTVEEMGGWFFITMTHCWTYIVKGRFVRVALLVC